MPAPRTLLACEALAIPAVAALVAVLVDWLAVSSIGLAKYVPALQMVTVGVVAVVGVLFLLAARLRRDSHLTVVAAAWLFYALAVTPLITLQALGYSHGVIRTGKLVVYAAFLGLLVLATTRNGVRIVGRAFCVALALTVAAMVGAALLPEWAPPAVQSRALSGVVAVCWLAVACWFTADGVRRGIAVRSRMGFGLGIVAMAHASMLFLPSSVPFHVLRVIGLLVVAAAAGATTAATVRQLRRQWQDSAEQAAAYARRDHEMGNALANLAAVPTLITGELDKGKTAEILASELARMRALLDGRPPDNRHAAPVFTVLSRLVTLRRAGGMRVALYCPPRMHAALPADVLAQAVSNALNNCARHAPGATVLVHARRAGDRCIVEVSDDGPGIAAGAQSGIPGGSGLGLAVTTELLRPFHARFALHAGQGSGCTAYFDLPLPAPYGTPSRRAGRVLVETE